MCTGLFGLETPWLVRFTITYHNGYSHIGNVGSFIETPTGCNHNMHTTNASQYYINVLTQAQMTHIYVSKLIIIGSDYGMSPGRSQAII